MPSLPIYNAQRSIQFKDRSVLYSPFNLSLVQFTQIAWHLNTLYHEFAKYMAHDDAVHNLIPDNVNSSLWHRGSVIFLYTHSDDRRNGVKFLANRRFVCDKIDPVTRYARLNADTTALLYAFCGIVSYAIMNNLESTHKDKIII